MIGYPVRKIMKPEIFQGSKALIYEGMGRNTGLEIMGVLNETI